MATKTINTILNLKDKFSNKLKQAANQTKQQSRQMQLLNNHIRTFRETATTGFGAVARSAAATAAAFVGIEAAISSVQNGIQFIQDYKSSMDNLQASTGATAAEMASMKASITDLYKSGMGESWSDLTNAMQSAKQVTGQQGAELKKTTALAIAYRDVFGEDYNQSLKTADTAMHTFGITSTDTFNLLAQGQRKGLNKSGELLDSVNEYGTHFKALGFSANQMFDTFSAGLDAGAFNLDKVGDAVKEFNIRSKDMSQSTLDAYKALGFNAEKMTQTFAKGGPEAQKAFRVILQSISAIEDPVKKNAIGVALMGTQFEDLEAGVIEAMGSARSQFDMTNNTMGEINKVKYNNVTQAFKGIGRMAETSILMPIGDRVLPKLSQFGEWFKQNSPKIEAGIQKAFDAGSKVIDGFAKAIAWAKDNASWLTPVIAGLTAAIVAQKVVNTVSGLYKTWSTILKGMTIAQWALNAAMNANPFGLIALAIGAAVAAGILIWKNWDTIKAKALELWGSLKTSFSNIKVTISGIWSQISTFLDSFPIGRGLLQNIKNVIESFKSIFNGAITFIKGVFSGNWSQAWDGIVEAFKGTFGLISSAAKAPLNALIGLINTVIDGLNSLSIDIPDWVPKVGGKKFGISIPHIPNFALGTSYFKGGLAQINERGGELVNLPNGSQIIPADKTEKMIDSSRGGITVEIYVQGNVIGEEDFLNRVGSGLVNELKLALGNM